MPPPAPSKRPLFRTQARFNDWSLARLYQVGVPFNQQRVGEVRSDETLYDTKLLTSLTMGRTYIEHRAYRRHRTGSVAGSSDAYHGLSLAAKIFLLHATISSMHRALGILEIVEMVCAEVGADLFVRHFVDESAARRDLAVLARSSKLFLDPALNALWRKQYTVVNFLRYMPSDVWDVDESDDAVQMNLRRPIMPADWMRPQFYLHRVRTSMIMSPIRSSDIALLETIALCLAGECIFPKLEVLLCEWYSDNISPFQHIPLLLIPRVQVLALPVDTLSHMSLLPTIALKCPSLKKVDIFGPVPDSSAIRILVKSLGRLESLKILSVDRRNLALLAGLPNLRSLLLRNPTGPYAGVSHESTNETGGFPALEKLQFVTANLDTCSDILALASDSRLVSFATQWFQVETTKDIAGRFYTTLAEHSSRSSLRDITVFQPRSSPDVATANQIEAYAVGKVELRPLFRFTDLVSLSLAHPVGFDLDDSTILAMACAWPRLQTLSLQSTLTRHMPSRVTLLGLHALAKHCPNLSELHMTLDATVVPEIPHDRVVQTTLELLHVGASPVAEPLLVAAFISGIFPKLPRVETLHDDIMMQYWEENMDDNGNLPNPAEDIDVDAEIAAFGDIWGDVTVAMHRPQM
ncbi:hypothetical protein B0H16DRAFT_1710957 [Mycena metata]|uniref:F-box domain-containing protein n=1 Tax=Mycena metata TaxID=1033252 RepID=A0AAD7NXV7_9AGAR|nr:hypothetical protein B0H16DRAFT_1710957 [Mycena metata]